MSTMTATNPRTKKSITIRELRLSEMEDCTIGAVKMAKARGATPTELGMLEDKLLKRRCLVEFGGKEIGDDYDAEQAEADMTSTDRMCRDEMFTRLHTLDADEQAAFLKQLTIKA